MTASITIRDLEHRFGEGGFELRIPALDVAGGEHVAIIGPSGSGKSTLLNLIAGILLPFRGSVVVSNAEWKQLSESRRRGKRIRELGLVFQEFELLEHLSVRENVLLPFYLNSALRLDAAAEARSSALLEAAGIEHHASKKPREMSQGERQRVALCRALVARPALLIADEPTGNLDPENARRAVELLRTEARKEKSTFLLVTHDHSLLPGFDRVLDLSRFKNAARDADGAR